jgi:DNA-binding transcriptional LysR family regulator
MGILDDTAVFAAVVQQGGFSRAAKHLGLSNGMISRRIFKLEEELGVTLLKRTTRQLQLTPEGELFWQHAKQIQQEMDKALCVIHALADKPTGYIRLSAPTYFGLHYLVPILNQFRDNFPEIKIDLFLTDQHLDPIKHNIDLLIRGAGYFEQTMKDSSLKTRLLSAEPIHLYATSEYLVKYGVPATPQDLLKHIVIGHADLSQNTDTENWHYVCKGKSKSIQVQPTMRISDVEGRLAVCLGSQGIGRFSAYINKEQRHLLQRVLPDYDWGQIHLYAVYAQQQALPKRTRLLMDFIAAQMTGMGSLI